MADQEFFILCRFKFEIGFRLEKVSEYRMQLGQFTKPIS